MLREKLNTHFIKIKISTFIATLHYIGFIPYFPGTWGSLMAILWAILIMTLTHKIIFIFLTIFILLISIPCIKLYEKYHEKHDPKEIVIDELVGMWISLWPLKAIDGHIIIAFILFRFFDIKKPGIIGYIDQKNNGFHSVMADDIMAGCFTALIMWGIVSL